MSKPIPKYATLCSRISHYLHWMNHFLNTIYRSIHCIVVAIRGICANDLSASTDYYRFLGVSIKPQRTAMNNSNNKKEWVFFYFTRQRPQILQILANNWQNISFNKGLVEMAVLHSRTRVVVLDNNLGQQSSRTGNGFHRLQMFSREIFARPIHTSQQTVTV